MRLLVSILPLALLAACGPRAGARPDRAGGEAARPADALHNGLALDVVARPGTGVVALHLRLSAGAQHERPDAAGAAQAGLEAFLGDEEGLRADVRRMGGQIRGYVTRDATDIEVVVGKDQLAEALARVGARLGRLTVDAATWRAIAPRLDDAQHLARRDDTRRATEAVVADLYDGHALARAPLPDSAALGKLLPEQITSYLEARYRPRGAHLVVVGDVDAAEVRREAADALGPWSGGVAVVQHGAPTPPGELALRLLDTRAEKATLALAFPADAATPGDAAALDLLAALAEVRLQAGLRRAGVPADAVRVFASTPEGGGFILARCRVPATAIDASWQVLVTSVVAQAGVPAAPGTFDEARRRVDDAGRALDVEGEARWRAAVQGRWPDAPLDAWHQALDAAQARAIADTARGVLRLDRAAAVILAPDAVRTDDDGPWAARLMEQAFSLARPEAAPPAGVHRRGEGLTVVVHPMAGATGVGLVVRIEGGAAQVPAKRAGLAAMVAAALAEPAAGEPAFQAQVAADHILLSTEVLPTHLGAALDALERRLGQLEWTPARTEAARAMAQAALHHATTHGAERVEQLFREAAGLPEVLGTEAALGDLAPGVVRAWYQAHVREAALLIGVAGAVDTRIVSGLERRFAQRRPATTRPAPAPRRGRPARHPAHPRRPRELRDGGLLVAHRRRRAGPGRHHPRAGHRAGRPSPRPSIPCGASEPSRSCGWRRAVACSACAWWPPRSLLDRPHRPGDGLRPAHGPARGRRAAGRGHAPAGHPGPRPPAGPRGPGPVAGRAGRHRHLFHRGRRPGLLEPGPHHPQPPGGRQLHPPDAAALQPRRGQGRRRGPCFSLKSRTCMSNTTWWQAQAEVPAELAETAAWLLAEALGVAVEVQDAGTLTKADNAEVAWVVVGLEDAPDDALRLAFGEVLQSLGLPVNIQTRRRDDQDWRDGWKAFFRPLRLSTRFAVRPPWEADLPDVAHHIIIDPGMAFGTGQHATTRGVLAALDDVLGDRPSATVLDVGTGSGILAIAAALLGHTVVATDNDAVALENAAENLVTNGVADRVRLVVGERPDEAATFPVVVVNIIAPVLIALAEDVKARVAGDLLLGPARDAGGGRPGRLRPLTVVDRREDGDWVILHLRAA
ncbi:MAG: 50S ribosomal protein L11 methyltransferase [bacterium]